MSITLHRITIRRHPAADHTVPVNTAKVIILRTAFPGIPESAIESAAIDGANGLAICIRIAPPLNKATLAVVRPYCAASCRSSLFTASLRLRKGRLFPLQHVLRETLIADDSGNADSESMGAPSKYAVIIVSTLPILRLCPFLQNRFARDAMTGAVQG